MASFGNPSPVYIGIFGGPRAGKTTFIQEALTGNSSRVNLAPTKDVHVLKRIVVHGRPVVLIDTPSFYNRMIKDLDSADILKRQVAFLIRFHENGHRLDSIIFINPKTNLPSAPWMAKHSSYNWSIFQHLVGDMFFPNVIFASTGWSIAPTPDQLAQEAIEASQEPFRSCVKRVNWASGPSPRGALDILRMVLEQQPAHLSIQHNLIDRRILLADTKVANLIVDGARYLAQQVPVAEGGQIIESAEIIQNKLRAGFEAELNRWPIERNDATSLPVSMSMTGPYFTSNELPTPSAPILLSMPVPYTSAGPVATPNSRPQTKTGFPGPPPRLPAKSLPLSNQCFTPDSSTRPTPNLAANHAINPAVQPTSKPGANLPMHVPSKPLTPSPNRFAQPAAQPVTNLPVHPSPRPPPKPTAQPVSNPAGHIARPAAQSSPNFTVQAVTSPLAQPTIKPRPKPTSNTGVKPLPGPPPKFSSGPPLPAQNPTGQPVSKPQVPGPAASVMPKPAPTSAQTPSAQPAPKPPAQPVSKFQAPQPSAKPVLPTGSAVKPTTAAPKPTSTLSEPLTTAPQLSSTKAAALKPATLSAKSPAATIKPPARAVEPALAAAKPPNAAPKLSPVVPHPPLTATPMNKPMTSTTKPPVSVAKTPTLGINPPAVVTGTVSKPPGATAKPLVTPNASTTASKSFTMPICPPPPVKSSTGPRHPQPTAASASKSRGIAPGPLAAVHQPLTTAIDTKLRSRAENPALASISRAERRLPPAPYYQQPLEQPKLAPPSNKPHIALYTQHPTPYAYPVNPPAPPKSHVIENQTYQSVTQTTTNQSMYNSNNYIYTHEIVSNDSPPSVSSKAMLALGAGAVGGATYVYATSGDVEYDYSESEYESYDQKLGYDEAYAYNGEDTYVAPALHEYDHWTPAGGASDTSASPRQDTDYEGGYFNSGIDDHQAYGGDGVETLEEGDYDAQESVGPDEEACQHQEHVDDDQVEHTDESAESGDEGCEDSNHSVDMYQQSQETDPYAQDDQEEDEYEVDDVDSDVSETHEDSNGAHEYVDDGVDEHTVEANGLDEQADDSDQEYENGIEDYTADVYEEDGNQEYEQEGHASEDADEGEGYEENTYKVDAEDGNTYESGEHDNAYEGDGYDENAYVYAEGEEGVLEDQEYEHDYNGYDDGY